MKSRISLFLLFCSLTIYASPLFSQTATTSLRGQVTDPQGAVLTKATVTLNNPDTGFSRSVQTDASGNYQFPQIPPGRYELTTAAPGFRATKRQVELLVNTPATVNTKLSVEAAGTTVEVTAEVPTINTQDATVGNAVTNTQLQGLPFEGRDPAGILSLQPGVTFVGNNVDLSYDTRQGAVNGARSDQTNVILDGVDNNDLAGFGQPFQGALRTPLDSIQELRVTTSTANAEAGRSSGAQVVEVTRTGTNSFHGSLYEYNRGLVRSANDWFNKQSQVQAGEPNVPGKLIRNTFGARVGGPIWKDRLFFFANYEGQRTRENLQVTRVVPTAELRAGIVRYFTCGAGQPTDCDPSQQRLVTLTPAQLASMDPGCVANGTCPWGGGANPNVLAAWATYPLPNLFTTGDGLNFAGFTFAARTPGKLDTYLIRLDANLTADGRHKVFIKPQMQNDNFVPASPASAPQFPDQPASEVRHDNSKGIAALYTAAFTPTFVNNLRYGFIRQGVTTSGVQTQPFVQFRGLDQPFAITPTQFTILPVHNIVDDVSWTRGKHTIQFGANYRRVSTDISDNSTSFFSGLTNVSFLGPAAIANTGTDLDPAAFGFPEVSDSFSNNYDNPVTALTGLVTEVGSNYIRDKTGAVLPEGTPAVRHFRNNEYEAYIQDQWRVTSSLTLTGGLRYTYLQAPYEVNGTQVVPDVNLNDWFMARHDAMLKGEAFNQLLTYQLGGKANNQRGYWSPQKANFAPRVALAWSPSWSSGIGSALFGGPGKSSFRAGYGIYYDHFGSGLVSTFNQFGSFGLATQLENSAGIQEVPTVPRFTGLNTIPTALQVAAPVGGFPYTPPTDIDAGGFAIAWGLNSNIKTPYSHVMSASFQRELPKQFAFEITYVGRLGRHLLQELDLAMPEDIVDPATGVNYFTAATQFAQAANAGVNIRNMAPIPYWENMFPGAAGSAANRLSGCAPGADSFSGHVTATQAMYDEYACNLGNETTALFDADVLCSPSCSRLGPYAYFDSQFSSLYAQSTIGTSSYHAMQLMLRRQAGALQFQFNYTLGRSEDMGSNPERISLFNTFGYSSQIINSWSPKQLYAPSDWDTRHEINGNWVYDLPFGRGRPWLNDRGGFVNQLVGGWQVSGLARWTSAFPFNIGPGLGFWPTNWELTSNAILNGTKPKTGTFRVVNDACPQSCPNVFEDPANALTQFRLAFPGESGQRNNLRGPGIFTLDMGVSKSFTFEKSQSVLLAVEAFNLTNTPRFDVGGLQNPLTGNNTLANGSQFGNFINTASRPRVLQFAVRYNF